MLAEDLVKGAEVGQEEGITAAPFMIVEIVGEEFHFNEGFALGVEMAAGITAEVFDLIVETFGQVGGAELGVKRGWVFEEGEIVGGSFFEVFDIGLVGGAELVKQSAEFALSGFEAAGGLDFAPGFFEGGVIVPGEVALGVA